MNFKQIVLKQVLQQIRINLMAKQPPYKETKLLTDFEIQTAEVHF